MATGEPTDPLECPARRDWMREAACVAGAWASLGACPVLAADNREVHHYTRALLVDPLGEPITASALVPGHPRLFDYPYVASPAFLIAIDRSVDRTALVTEARRAYDAPEGVGRKRSIVAFSAICAHKLMYPTPQISFIGLRKGNAGEPSQVIHCCGDQSRYDPAAGARVIGGPAPQPLAAVLLEWDPATDRLHAVGTQGGEMFEAFFEKYAFRLGMDKGPRARAPVGDRTVTRPAAEYSRQWQRCAV